MGVLFVCNCASGVSYTDSLFQVYKSNQTNDTAQAKILIEMGRHFLLNQPDSSMSLFKQAQSQLNLLIQNSKKSKEYSIAVEKILSKTIRYIGIAYFYKGMYPEAMQNYQNSLALCEKTGDEEGMAHCLNNIGNVQYNQGNFDQALEYYSKSLEIRTRLNDKRAMSDSYNNLGIVYINQEKPERALYYYKKSLDLKEETEDLRGMPMILMNIGIVYATMDNKVSALEYFQKALQIVTKLNDQAGIASILGNIAKLYNELGSYRKAIEYAEKSLTIAKEIQSLYDERIAYEHLSAAHDSLGLYKQSLKYYKQYKMISDSIFNAKKSEQLAQMEAVYQNEKKEQQIELQKTQLEKKEAEVMQQQAIASKQRFQRNVFIGGFGMLAIFAFIVFRNYKEKQRANKLLASQNEEILQQKEEISAQRDEIQNQNLVIERKNKMVTDSINYAKSIQSAVLPAKSNIEKLFKESFILFMPKDIVSGDFYWVAEKNGLQYFSVIDCTGHGVPGAFMSMMGITFLNEIIARPEIETPGQIMDELRKNVIRSLNQKGADKEQKDGMDMTLISFDEKNRRLQFAGAFNPIYIITTQDYDSLSIRSEADVETQNGMVHKYLYEIKGDSMPVGIHDKMRSFKTHSIEVNKEDTIILFSDGYCDQFGGPKGKKFTYRPFRELLLKNSNLPMDTQLEILESTIKKWRNNFGKKHEQIDDITVMGIKI